MLLGTRQMTRDKIPDGHDQYMNMLSDAYQSGHATPSSRQIRTLVGRRAVRVAGCRTSASALLKAAALQTGCRAQRRLSVRSPPPLQVTECAAVGRHDLWPHAGLIRLTSDVISSETMAGEAQAANPGQAGNVAYRAYRTRHERTTQAA